MLADDIACNPRNVRPGRVFDRPLDQLTEFNQHFGGASQKLVPARGSPFVERDVQNPHWGGLGWTPGAVGDPAGEEDGFSQANLFLPGIEVDFRGPACNVETLLRILTGRMAASSLGSLSSSGPLAPGSPTPAPLLASDASSRLLIYLTGHGGDGFLKFHDQQELTAEDLARALRLMWLQRRFARALVLVDTCQAATINEQLATPHTAGVGSSARGQNSFSRENDDLLGVAVADRFSFGVSRWLDQCAFEGGYGGDNPAAGGGLVRSLNLARLPPQNQKQRHSQHHRTAGARASSLADLLGSVSQRELRSSVVLSLGSGHPQRAEDWALLWQQLNATGAALDAMAVHATRDGGHSARLLGHAEEESIEQFDAMGFFKAETAPRMLVSEYPLTAAAASAGQTEDVMNASWHANPSDNPPPGVATMAFVSTPPPLSWVWPVVALLLGLLVAADGQWSATAAASKC